MSLKKGYMPIAKSVHDITYLKILYEVAVFIGVFGSVLLYQKITKTKILGTHFDFNNKPLFFSLMMWIFYSDQMQSNSFR